MAIHMKGQQFWHPAAYATLTQEVTPFLFTAEQEMTQPESQLRSQRGAAHLRGRKTETEREGGMDECFISCFFLRRPSFE